MLYPCLPSQTPETLQNQLSNDNRMLWATLTPNGPQHYISSSSAASYNPPQPTPTPATLAQHDDHYEVIDHQLKVHQNYTSNTTSRVPVKSFENSAFTDYDYEDPTKYAESYRTDDMDSGYQEPQDIIIGSLPRSPRHHNTINITSSPIHHHNSQHHHLPIIINNSINSSPQRSFPPPYHQQSPQHYHELIHQQHSLHHQHHSPHHQQKQQQQYNHYNHPHRNISISTLNRKTNSSRKTNCDDGSSSGRFNI